MSASDNLSGEQFFDVHRGIRAEKPEQPLGIHWTDDEAVAHVFADPGTWGDKNTVVNAKVRQKDIVDPYSREGKKMAKEHAIFKPENAEREVTVRPGSTVQVTSIIRKGERRDGSRRDRVRLYKQPRKMQA